MFDSVYEKDDSYHDDYYFREKELRDWFPWFFRPDHEPTLKEALGILRDIDCPDLAAALESTIKPCFFIREAGSGVAGSQIGGLPHLPESLVWPTWKGQPQLPLAQIHLAEVPSSPGREELPSSGTLYFFCGIDDNPWGYDPDSTGCWSVLYNPEAPLPHEPTPPPEAETQFYTRLPITFVPGSSLDDRDTTEHDITMSEKDPNRVSVIFGRLAELEYPRHQLLGHPCTIQNDMREQCEEEFQKHRGTDYYKNDGPNRSDPDKPDWRLLLQVDTDNRLNMMWGDMGHLYFWIREQDLRACRFENTWMILQCT